MANRTSLAVSFSDWLPRRSLGHVWDAALAFQPRTISSDLGLPILRTLPLSGRQEALGGEAECCG